MPGQPKAVEFSPQPAVAGQQLAGTTYSALFGWTVNETAGAAAKFRLRDGSTSSAPRLTEVIELAANASDDHWFDDHPPEITSGKVYVDVLAGSIEGVVYAA